jgi:tetratricopeptide (TPR) repeat protein
MSSAFSITGVVAIAVASCAVLAQVPDQHVHSPSGKATKLGLVAFANSGAQVAQEPFLRGLALLHSFEYEEAAEGFREAQAADAGFAMAYWGEALTFSHLLWGEDDVAGARAALARLGATRESRLEKAGTPREREFGAAIEALYVDADLAVRVRGFADATRQLSARYPDDPDAASFASLALMFTDYQGKLSAEERQAARNDSIAFAERVFRANPEHPGGTHYLIHATDSPATAPRGLEAARRYAAIAPDAEHALHMPSHIFLQLGMWDDTVASNERAWAASRKEVVARKLTNADLSFHALQWLQYGYLQQGRYRDARGLIETRRELMKGVDLDAGEHVDARFAPAWMDFVQAANTGQWSGDVCAAAGLAVEPLRGSTSREQSFRAVTAYQRTIVTLMCGSSEAGRAFLDAQLAKESSNERTSAMLRTAQVHAMLIGVLRGDDVPAKALDAATLAPDQALVGPPLTLRTNELLGEIHLKQGRPAEAIAAYDRALKTTPNRAAALLGLARARAASGDLAGAKEAYKQLLANWHHADADLPQIAEARGGS